MVKNGEGRERREKGAGGEGMLERKEGFACLLLDSGGGLCRRFRRRRHG